MWLNQQTVNLSPLGYLGSIPSASTKLKIMKNNRKNRKLNFIIYKNKLRLGFTKFYLTDKKSVSVENSNDYFENLIILAKRICLKKWKLTLNKIEVKQSQTSEDFLNDTITTRIILSA